MSCRESILESFERERGYRKYNSRMARDTE